MTVINDRDVPRGFTLSHTLRGHQLPINRIVWAPDGRLLASASNDKSVRVWDTQSGRCLHVIGKDNIPISGGHKIFLSMVSPAFGIAWSPDGNFLALGNHTYPYGSRSKGIWIWNVRTRQIIRTLTGHEDTINDLLWSPDGEILASGSADFTIRFWQPDLARSLGVVNGHGGPVLSVAWSSDSTLLASGSEGRVIRIWPRQMEVEPTKLVAAQSALRGIDVIQSLKWLPGTHYLASGSRNGSIQLWDVDTDRLLTTLEGHIAAVTSIAFSHDGSLLASKSLDGTVQVRSMENGEIVAILPETSSNNVFAGLAFHPSLPVLATLGEKDKVIRIWELDIAVLRGGAPVVPPVHYSNAKVVLVGEPGVGKSGLSLVLTGQPYIPTNSTHGRYIWNFDKHKKQLENDSIETRETILWDLAGQPGYRLIHQLHLGEVAVALVVFDAHNATDPFAGISHWVRALKMAQRAQGIATPVKKLLVAARIDRGIVKVSQKRINALMERWGFDGYYETSALDNIGITALVEGIKAIIEWDKLPKVTSNELFQRIRTFLVLQKEEKRILSTSEDLYRDFLHTQSQLNNNEVLRASFETCIGLAEAQGLLRRLSFGSLILLKPELLDAYASTLINAARTEPDELGCIAEEKVKNFKDDEFLMPKGERLRDREQEKLLLIAMIEDLLRHEIALREQGSEGAILVFPSEAIRENPDMPDPTGKAMVFDFEGSVLNIYTTLAVRLSYSEWFQKSELWKNAITYSSKTGGICGIFLEEKAEEGHGKLTLFFDKVVSNETCYRFEEFVKLHLERRALGTINMQHIFVCPGCQRSLDNEVVRRRRERGFNWIFCELCDTKISLLTIEENLAITRPLQLKEIARTESIAEMDRAAASGVNFEVNQLTVQGKQATDDFDVFLCYNGADKSAVKAIGEQLKAKGLLPWLDEWELRPGISWQRQLELQIGKIKSAAVFVGADGIGPWEWMESEAFLREFVSRGCPVIPVILENASREPQLPIFLRGMTWVDFRRQEPDSMERLIWGITGKKDLSV